MGGSEDVWILGLHWHVSLPTVCCLLEVELEGIILELELEYPRPEGLSSAAQRGCLTLLAAQLLLRKKTREEKGD